MLLTSIILFENRYPAENTVSERGTTITTSESKRVATQTGEFDCLTECLFCAFWDFLAWRPPNVYPSIAEIYNSSPPVTPYKPRGGGVGFHGFAHAHLRMTIIMLSYLKPPAPLFLLSRPDVSAWSWWRGVDTTLWAVRRLCVCVCVYMCIRDGSQ